jgi:hypothetical protein
MNSYPIILPQEEELQLNKEKILSKGLPRMYPDRQKNEYIPIPPRISREGITEAQKDIVKTANVNNEKFDDVVKRSRTILFKTKTVFPFDFFPSDFIIDVTKVTVVTRRFFFSGYTQSIHIKDIMDVIVESGPFFSSLSILDLGYLQQNKLYVRHMRKSDAILARQMIEGLKQPSCITLRC